MMPSSERHGTPLLALGLRAALSTYLRILAWAGRRKARTAGAPGVILLTGTFFSANWLSAHVRPLAASHACRKVVIVAARPLFEMEKVEWVCPGNVLRRLFGDVGARLVVFVSHALRTRPDYVGGFHLLFNGLSAILLAKALGIRSIYFAVGGSTEVDQGGFLTENRIFSHLGRPDEKIEGQLLRAIGSADLVVTMGTGAAAYFRSRAGAKHVLVHPGTVASMEADPTVPKDVDILYVGRLVPIKRLDLFLDVVALVARDKPDLRVVLVGEGPLRLFLENRIHELALADRVDLVGFHPDVRPWLRRSKLLMLTSESEGLSLAVMEAMAGGVPAVVPNVGDLGDLVATGVNGFLVAGRNPEEFASRATSLLSAPGALASFGEAARASAMAFDLGPSSQKWDEFLASAPAQTAIAR